ncbi:hypothetical protein [Dyella mobilis]|uniref:Uncharacterized protein n=1 Tax=Dyella mobilis TaxID=1849582 RepID=A0ABS2KGP8_9GAMM|nr:hypothetical protein [Dyella mobilis]MBM7129548.1 hypothetical protein [Dyella mobilis]
MPGSTAEIGQPNKRSGSASRLCNHDEKRKCTEREGYGNPEGDEMVDQAAGGEDQEYRVGGYEAKREHCEMLARKIPFACVDFTHHYLGPFQDM